MGIALLRERAERTLSSGRRRAVWSTAVVDVARGGVEVRGPEVELQRGVDVGGVVPTGSDRGCRRVGIGGWARAVRRGRDAPRGRRVVADDESDGGVARVARVVVDVDSRSSSSGGRMKRRDRDGRKGQRPARVRRSPRRAARARSRDTVSCIRGASTDSGSLSISNRGARRAARASGPIVVSLSDLVVSDCSSARATQNSASPAKVRE